MKRQVYIQPVTRNGKVLAYMVCYVTRRKGQRHSAAQFESLDSLMTWLATQPNLELVEKQNG